MAESLGGCGASMKPSEGWLHLLWIVPGAGLLFWFALPILTVWRISLQGADGAQWMRFLTSSLLWHTLGQGFVQASVSTLFTLTIALPISIIWLLYDVTGRKWLQVLLTLPFVLPTVVVAAGFRALWGSEGLLNRLLVEWIGFPTFEFPYGWAPVILAHVFYNVSVVFRVVTGYGGRIGADVLESACCLGHSPLGVVRRVLFPMLRPAIFSAALVVFLFCFGSFGVVLLLGGSTMTTLDVEIYRQTVYFFHMRSAAQLSVVQFCCTLLVVFLHRRLSPDASSIALFQSSAGSILGRPRTSRGRAFLTGTCVVYAIGFGLPLAAILVQAFRTSTGWGFDYFSALLANDSDALFFVEPVDAVIRSLQIACLAAAFCLTFGFPAAQFLADPPSSFRMTTFVHGVFLLPLGASPVILGLGFILTFAVHPIDFRSSWLLIPVSHALVAFPVFLQTVLPALRGIPDVLKQAAATLGSSPWHGWLRVQLPLIRNSLTAALILSFMISLGEFGATIFIARPHVPTLPIAIYRYLSQPGEMNYGRAMAMAAILLGLTTFGFTVLERIGKQR